MVRAILESRKTQTRRIIKPQPDDSGLHDHSRFPMSLESIQKGWWGTDDLTGEMRRFNCRYGQIGDVLWVRESFRIIRGNVTGDEYDYPAETIYKADGAHGPFKPSIHMPKSACRIFLEITDMRVERIQDITAADCLAEGITAGDYPNDIPAMAFVDLWMTINGEGSWISNPWAWVVCFQRIDKPENF